MQKKVDQVEQLDVGFTQNWQKQTEVHQQMLSCSLVSDLCFFTFVHLFLSTLLLPESIHWKIYQRGNEWNCLIYFTILKINFIDLFITEVYYKRTA